MKKVVISQPMFAPWLGLFEQVKLTDIYVHLDDVQFPQGRSLTNRVQIKTPQGPKWLTVPVQHQGIELINNVLIDNTQNWKEKHLNIINSNYKKTPYFKEMLEIIELSYSFPTDKLSDLNIFMIEKIADYFGLHPIFVRSSTLGITSKSTNRLLEIVKNFNGDTYITGHGARNYLDHELFENNNIKVEYMNYNRSSYPQLHGDFDAHVSSLDLIANVGRKGEKFINSQTKQWRDFINE